jgi:hypothetical protein
MAVLALVQGLYYLVTGAWSPIHSSPSSGSRWTPWSRRG